MRKIVLLLSIGFFLLSPSKLTAAREEIAELEKMFLVDGEFMMANKLSNEYMKELDGSLSGEETLILNLYAGLSSVSLSVADATAVSQLELAKQLAVDLYEAGSRYEGLANLGLVWAFTEVDANKALQYADSALSILQQTCGEVSYETAWAENVIGYAYFFAGKTAEAAPLVETSISHLAACDMQETWPYAHALTKRSVVNIGKKQWEAAVEDIGSAVDVLGEAEMQVSYPALLTYATAVYVFTACRALNEAISIGKDTLEIMTKLELEKTSDYAATLQNIGTAYLLKKDKGNARAYYLKSKALYEEVGATDIAGYKQVLKNISYLSK